MAATIYARRKGASRDIVADQKHPGIDPGSDAQLTRLGRQIADDNGVPEGDLRLRVYGGPRVRDLYV